MAKTVIGLFDAVSQAQDAIQNLLDHGFDRERISLVARALSSPRP